MRAAVRTRYGPPEVVRIAEVDQPAAGDDEVLVKVHATTVNRTDCGVRAAKPFLYRLFLGPVRPRLAILGNEFAGQVEAVGAAVTAFAPGDRVFGWRSERFGAHAEYLAMPANGSLATIPAELTYEEAAPGTEGAHYALSLIRAAGIGGGHDVLVNGATGAIGSAAVQLLAHLGATVTAVCDSANLELVRRLGAGRVIDYTAEDFTRDGQAYDVVLDAVGNSSFGRCRRLLRPGGSYLSTDLGPLSQNPFLALVTPAFRGRRVKFPIPRQNPETIRYLRGLLESGAFRPLVDRRYPLDEIVDAYRYVETGRKLGNVVISVVPPGP
ncbi:MAG TPA: NAD(P)-dependent alcohol dehydrogenase [Actinomycetota bacterium]|nr:NAD(P)-dependent alcohol dehydrogenase [Actinomycetota bacterium]